MNIQIIQIPYTKTLQGARTTHDASRSYAEEIMELLDKVWPVIKEHDIPNEGVSVWDGDNQVFVGVEADVPAELASMFDRKELNLQKYAYWKHVGSYSALPGLHPRMRAAIDELGERLGEVCVEVYGHWTEDESKLETDILYELT